MHLTFFIVCVLQRRIELSRAWNERFQRILREPDSIAKFKKLSNLAQNFVFTAEQVQRIRDRPRNAHAERYPYLLLLQYGRIIIEEYYLPLHLKTLKPGGALMNE